MSGDSGRKRTRRKGHFSKGMGGDNTRYRYAVEIRQSSLAASNNSGQRLRLDSHVSQPVHQTPCGVLQIVAVAYNSAFLVAPVQPSLIQVFL